MDIIAELLEKAEGQEGFLAVDDVLEALASLQGKESLEHVLAELRQAGVEIEANEGEVAGEDVDEDDEDEEVDDDLAFLEGIEEEDLDWDEDVYNLDGIGVDDTVALYLREWRGCPSSRMRRCR